MAAGIQTPRLLERGSTFWFVACLITFLFAVANWPWHLDDYDQAKQAFTSFEMVQEGHWLYQHTPNEAIATKPPLLGWVAAAVFGVTRSWEAAWRLPSIAAGIGLLLFLTRAATQAFGATGGLLAMSALGLNLLSPRLATLVRTDMALALIVFLIGLQIWRKTRAPGEGWRSRDRVICFALLTIAMLIKGPIVLAFLLPGIVVYQWTARDGKVSGWCGWWPWVVSLAVFLLWVAGGVAWVPGFYERVVLHEFAGRFNESVHRSQPFYFYLTHLLHRFAPWSVFMIALAMVGLRKNQGTMRERWRQLSPGTRWLVCWSLGGLVVMSFIPSKRVDRIFPVIPPLCLLLAAQHAWIMAHDELVARARQWAQGALAIACLVVGGYVTLNVGASIRSDEAALVRFGAAVRAEASAHNWRYEVIGGREEGMLLYLRRMHFTQRAKVAAQWNEGALDAVVVPEEELPGLLGELAGAMPSRLEATATINGHPRRYVLLTR